MKIPYFNLSYSILLPMKKDFVRSSLYQNSYLFSFGIFKFNHSCISIVILKLKTAWLSFSPLVFNAFYACICPNFSLVVLKYTNVIFIINLYIAKNKLNQKFLNSLIACHFICWFQMKISPA